MLVVEKEHRVPGSELGYLGGICPVERSVSQERVFAVERIKIGSAVKVRGVKFTFSGVCEMELSGSASGGKANRHKGLVEKGRRVGELISLLVAQDAAMAGDEDKIAGREVLHQSSDVVNHRILRVRVG